MKIRYISDDDLSEISNVYEESWKYAYKNIIPQSYLDSIPKGNWVDNINVNGRKNIVITENNIIIGTLSFCKSRWKEYSNYGEIVAIYFLPEYMGRGYGKYLLERGIQELKSMGFENILLWVLEENIRAREFYEKFGFTYSGLHMKDNIGGKQVTELMYLI